MDADRLNSPQTSAVLFEVMGYQLQFCQDPNSKHLGTTVWDASMVLVKYLEKNCRKGKFSPSKLKGKRVIELGAGCGVAGFGMAMLGCDVVSTDQVEVLPLLMRNVERNTSRIMQMNPDADSIGSITAAELSWGNDDHIRALDPPFDYIIGTDVVYAEHLLEPLLHTMLALSGPKTTILIGYEIRSTNVHEQMIQLWKKHFEVKTLPKSKMDIKYRHPSIQLYIMTLKTPEGIRNLDPVTENNAAEKIDDEADATEKVEDEAPQESRTLSDWEARRYGAMAARLLRDIKIS
ncbi:putative lysine methyltransferase, S-adenosyl-L-methionine-dependent methyltransferase [Helianthus annuus]|uniref:Lysine methyltransferase, S-adenosyl-L-methionine-dependent methyltransferase n=1 Tax=Helianthus annuus TaxID=4232 RepID=A0A251VJR3_HELAN|nr:protein-lysine methyltransferase METTL21D [Helianthus annuus]KAF5819827.1 putative lysine methyltransferase, S-adenosyl-L-methionine-dependent methyltransferase [Helianthus annuus]KAJ0619934.1 putative lysine methyltransferase, S-adenosyl-L-methionine-dependent methyltransferase [Helianthus annuus]KAJ0941313.1 putative lysine methyltransferase, S-adenosyl-L-methionine-dependent methyltransferase [Helianthus annuus]